MKFGDMHKDLNENREHLFPYEKLTLTKQDVWMNLQNFYGISSDFLSDNLYFQKDTNNSIVFLCDGLNDLMKCQRKYKLRVVNIGVKLFNKNRD